MKILGGILLLAALLPQISCAVFSDKAALEKNRRLWSESKISNYRMTTEIRKTGHRAPSGFALIEVRDQRAVSIMPAPGMQFGCAMGGCERYDTVEKIFAIIEDALKQSPEEFIAEYDSQYGYPKVLKLDVARTTLDDELTVKILQFEVLP